jgi:hypothetical protein
MKTMFWFDVLVIVTSLCITLSFLFTTVSDVALSVVRFWSENQNA